MAGQPFVNEVSAHNETAVFGLNSGDGQPAPTTGSPAGIGVFGVTVVPGAAGVFGANNTTATGPGSGRGVQGNGPEAGVGGFSPAGTGVLAQSNTGNAISATTSAHNSNAILAINNGDGQAAPTTGSPAGIGVLGVTVVPGAAGVFGANNATVAGATGTGVQGNGPTAGVSGFSPTGAGVLAESNSGNALVATTAAHNASAVLALNNGDGQAAPTTGSPAGIGVFGVTVVPGAAGVFGANNATVAGATGTGVQGNGPSAGVTGFSPAGAGVLAQTGNGIAIHAQGGGGQAGLFEGNVNVTGTINVGGDVILTGGGQDCAEQFDVSPEIAVDPGTVMVINSNGELEPSQVPYDKRAAGVISGAGDLRPAIVLGKPQSYGNNAFIALVGKVNCKVDAQYGCIEVGDLLTTSPTPGHAMKAIDPLHAFGAVIGKALRPLRAGSDLIPVLVALQ